MAELKDQIEVIRRSNEFVVVDIETSHFSPEKGAMIIELAAVKIRDGKIVDSRTQLIDPERRITKQITDITGISNEMLEGKPKFREVLPAFYDFIGDAVIVAHNAKFDWDRFLLYFFKKVGIEPKNHVVDTLVLSKMYLKNTDKKYSLGYLCEMVNIRLDDAHRALADTVATAKLFLHIKENFLSYDQVSLLDENPEKPPTQVPARPQSIRRAAYWEKSISGGKMLQRIYVTLDRSSVFWDIPTRSWEVKNSDEPIDFTQVQQDLLRQCKAASLDELVERWGKRGA